MLDQVVERLDIQLLQRFTAQRLHRDRHVLGVLSAPLRGDDDFLDGGDAGTGFAAGGLIRGRCHSRMRSQYRRDCARDLLIRRH